MVFLQFLGGSYFRSAQVRQYDQEIVGALISQYYDLVFDLNIIFALVFIINFVLRRYVIINDTKIYYISKLNIQVLSQYTVDILLVIISVIYTVLGIDTVYEVYRIV